MKRKQRFLLPLLMMVVMMAMSPQKVWAGACGYTPNCAAIEAMTIHKDGTNNNYNGSTNSDVVASLKFNYWLDIFNYDGDNGWWKDDLTMKIDDQELTFYSDYACTKKVSSTVNNNIDYSKVFQGFWGVFNSSNEGGTIGQKKSGTGNKAYFMTDSGLKGYINIYNYYAASNKWTTMKVEVFIYDLYGHKVNVCGTYRKSNTDIAYNYVFHLGGCPRPKNITTNRNTTTTKQVTVSWEKETYTIPTKEEDEKKGMTRVQAYDPIDNGRWSVHRSTEEIFGEGVVDWIDTISTTAYTESFGRQYYSIDDDGTHSAKAVCTSSSTPYYYYFVTYEPNATYENDGSSLTASETHLRGLSGTSDYIKMSHVFDSNGLCHQKDGETHHEPCSGNGTYDNPYIINNQGNLCWFSDKTNGENGLIRNLLAQGKLTTNLDMSGVSFTAIGLYSDTKSSNTYFQGVFDGQGHVISNLTVTVPETYEAGFVSRLQGTVKNLILYKETVKAKPYVAARIGGIAGLTHTNAVISCCGVIDATLKNENDKTNSVQLGGIVGGYSTGSIAFTFTDHNKFFGVGDLSIHTNCFENVSSDWKTSGELCWRLNGGAVTNQVWHQNLSGTSKDVYPIPTATNHSTVYMQYADKVVSFTNTNTSISEDQTISISTAAELNEVAHAIALGYSGKINVNQTADIDYTGYNTVNDMIGGDITNYGTGAIGSKVYKGTYDGQGHYVKVGFNFGEVRYVGLFRAVDGATIKRLHTTGSITTDELFCGGVVALVGNNRLSLQNVTSDVTITSTHTTDVGNGGLVGYSKVGTNYTNCAFYGKFVGASATTPYWGGLSGRADANDLITNCYVAFTTENIKSSQYNYTFSSKIDSNSKNYYRLNSLGTDQGTEKTADQFKSGEVCFLLNGGAVSGQAWYQTINTDSYPLLNNTRKTVYITLDKNCEFAYTHTPYADQTLSFEVGTAAKLNNVARLHANGFTGKVDVALTKDIDYTAYNTVYDMIGCYDLRAYKGTFDGQGHSLTVDFTHAENYVGPFRSINGATIKNLHLKGSVTNTGTTTSTGKFTGGVASHAIGDTCRLENVISDVQINCSLANDVTNGGIIAHVTVPVIIKNCAYRGKFNGANSYAWGGFIGWINPGQTATITNCYVALDSDSKYNSKSCATFARKGGTLAGGNNYYYSLIGVDNWSNCSQFEAGELCYKLNEGLMVNPVWRQNLGEDGDTYPVLTKKDDNIVYRLNHNYNNTGKLPVSLTAFDGKKYGAIYTDFPWTIDATDVKAYIAESNDNGVLKMTEASSVPAGTAVVFVGSTDGTASLTYNAEATGSQGILSGSDEAVAATDKYLFGRKDGIVGFYTTTAEQVAAFKPYLELGSDVKGYRMVFEDEETGIENVTSISPLGESEGAVYNLQGQKLAAPRRGINIINGKKVLVK